MTRVLTDFEAARTAMIDSQLRPSDVNDPDIVAAFARVAREDFVPEAAADFAYMDRPVPIAPGRALNPPIATGRMLIAAGNVHNARVLLIGAASGYTAALLVELGADVTAVESNAACTNMLGKVDGIDVIAAPLEQGAPAHAPYDIILIDGAIEHLPTALVDQLCVGGRVITGLAQGAVTQLAKGVKTHGSDIVLIPFADMEIVPLPGFARPKQFQF